jgi:hypothetical protein
MSDSVVYRDKRAHSRIAGPPAIGRASGSGLPWGHSGRPHRGRLIVTGWVRHGWRPAALMGLVEIIGRYRSVMTSVFFEAGSANKRPTGWGAPILPPRLSPPRA